MAEDKAKNYIGQIKTSKEGHTSAKAKQLVYRPTAILLCLCIALLGMLYYQWTEGLNCQPQLQKMEQRHKEELDEHLKNMQTVSDNLQEHLNAMNEKHQKVMKAVNDRHQGEIHIIRYSHQQELKDIKIIYEQNLKTKDAELEQQINEKQKHEEELTKEINRIRHECTRPKKEKTGHFPPKRFTGSKPAKRGKKCKG